MAPASRLVVAIGCLALPAAAGQPAGSTDGTAPPAGVAAEPITPIPAPPAAGPAKVALGERLFADTDLSAGRNLSCLSCHDVNSNGADARRFDAAPGQPALAVNTSTVFNAALSYRLTWHASFETLEQQTVASIGAPNLLGSSLRQVLPRLEEDRATRNGFAAVYGHGPDTASLLDALATYERSLLTPGSRFDRWLRGEPGALTAQERQGYQDFKAFGCVSCHQGVNVGGNLLQRSGIFHPLTQGEPPPPVSPPPASPPPASPPPAPLLRVPSLRNIAATAPYFHDGSAPDLRVAVRRMALAQLDRTLSEEQLDAVVAFLRTLSGTYRGNPVMPPP